MAITPSDAAKQTAEHERKELQNVEDTIDQTLGQRYKADGTRIVLKHLSQSAQDQLARRFMKNGWQCKFESENGNTVITLQEREAA